MRTTRPGRQAQTCGLTYCTVRMPAACSAGAKFRLNSGASTPMNRSGRAAIMRDRARRRSASSRGRCVSTSNRPITASDSAGSHCSHPAATMRGPAMPKNCASGWVSRSARISAAPRLSPEVSPATMPMRRARAGVVIAAGKVSSEP